MLDMSTTRLPAGRLACTGGPIHPFFNVKTTDSQGNSSGRLGI